MFRLWRFYAPLLFLTLLALAPAAYADATTDIKDTPSGIYQLDPDHASVTFKINHLGFSHYTGRFDKLEATLNFNKDDPAQSGLNVTIYPNSINTNNIKLEEDLRNEKWFNVIKYPRALFQSTKIERTGPTTGKISGNFTLMGVTHPITLDVTLIGTGTMPITGKQVLGFSATGTLRRSDYGMTNLVPMVSDDVTLEIEAEFDKTE